MDIKVFEKLYQAQLISPDEFTAVKSFNQKKLLSVQWDLRIVLYCGILLLISGLGIIIYENIDTIGHDAIVTLIAISFSSCFFYCFKKASRYSNAKIESPGLWYDYILLLGCLLLLLFIAYIQFQYQAFGNRLGMATFIPMIILFFTAYYFDHKGVLSLAITNLAAWLGITVTPAEILNDNDFSNERLIYTGLVLGFGLIALSALTKAKVVKAHFAFTYKNFGTHILLISLLAGLFHFDDIYLLWFVVLAACCWFLLKNAIKETSFYFFVITILYFYIGVSFVVLDLFFLIGDNIGVFYLGLLYLIGSGIGLIRVLMAYNKKFKSNDSLREK